jgi:hypothetical protein
MKCRRCSNESDHTYCEMCDPSQEDATGILPTYTVAKRPPGQYAIFIKKSGRVLPVGPSISPMAKMRLRSPGR